MVLKKVLLPDIFDPVIRAAFLPSCKAKSLLSAFSPNKGWAIPLHSIFLSSVNFGYDHFGLSNAILEILINASNSAIVSIHNLILKPFFFLYFSRL